MPFFPPMAFLPDRGNWWDIRGRVFQNPQPEFITQTGDPSERSRRLLDSHLTQKQRDTLSKGGYFIMRVLGSPFAIFATPSFNVCDLERRVSYCAYPLGVPLYDVLLAQKLILERDPGSFFRIANRHDSVPVTFLWAIYGNELT